MADREMTYAERQRADGFWTIVMRLASVSPQDVAGIVGHGEREDEPDHVDKARSHLNEYLVGGPEVAGQIAEMNNAMSRFNLKSKVAGVKKSRGRPAADAVRERGFEDPWIKNRKSGPPLREGIVTVHRDFFRAADDCPEKFLVEFLDDEGELMRVDTRKWDEFKAASMSYLDTTFGSMLVYARADFDEQSGHIHFLLADTQETGPSSVYAYGRKIWRVTQHELIGGNGGTKRGYELLQDHIGAWFAQPEHAHMKIVRGEGRAEKRREAQATAEKLLENAIGAAFLDGDELPEGSPEARARYVIKRKMEEAIAEKGSAGKVRKDTKQELALDWLALLGALDPARRHETKTRRAQTVLLAEYEALYGTAEDIIADPERAAETALAEARKRIAAENKAAANARADADREAAAERARLDREAAAERARLAEQNRAAMERRERKFVAREAALTEREVAVETRAAQLDEREEHLTKREQFVKFVIGHVDGWLTKIRSAAGRLGLLEYPAVSDALGIEDGLRDIDGRQRTR